MFKTLRKWQYGARVLLARGGGQPETIDVAGVPTVLLHGGDGPPFIYLHSTLGESMMWLPFHQALAQRFRVLAPLHPGFGDSGGFDRIDTIEDLAFHYIEFLDALGLDEVCLGGVSLGGWIAAEIACRWPERVRKLWLTSAPGLWVEDDPLPDLFRIMQSPQKAREYLFHDPTSAIADLMFARQPAPDQLVRAFQNLTVLARVIWDRPYDPKLAARLHRVRCPVLLLWGAHDRLVPPSYARAYQACLPQAELRLIENCGHLPMFEREAEFVSALTRFGAGG